MSKIKQNDNNILDISNVPYTVFFNISGGKIYIDEEYPNLIINDISENSTTTNLNTIYNTFLVSMCLFRSFA